MAQATIPVDLFNPGQVFACLGFLEAADILLGGAAGGFDWSGKKDTFTLQADGDENPVKAVLEFLAGAEVVIIYPENIDGSWPNDAKPDAKFPASPKVLLKSDKKIFSKNALPVQLEHRGFNIQISNWLNAEDGRRPFKLFAGNQVASTLIRDMLIYDEKKKGRKGLRNILPEIRKKNFSDPLNEVCAVGGRFGFDARGGWDALRIGTSLDKQNMLVRVSPLVELLAAIGLENTRPQFLSTYQIRYAVWSNCLPLILCRTALFSPDAFLPENQWRLFHSHLGDDQQYKKCFFAEEEISP